MRRFDLAEANRLVPLLQESFTSVRGWLERVQSLSQASEPKAQEERAELIAKISATVSKLEEMDIEVKAIDGLVDFRARMNGRIVYLCWRYDEPAVTHWHELDAGFTGRRPLDQAGVISPSYLS